MKAWAFICLSFLVLGDLFLYGFSLDSCGGAVPLCGLFQAAIVPWTLFWLVTAVV